MIASEKIAFVEECYREAELGKTERMRKSRENRLAYVGEQDWSYKIDGQSTEFLPRVGTAVDQFAASLKRGLVQFGPWFSVDVPKGSVLTADDIRKLLTVYLKKLPDGENDRVAFEVKLGDALKQGLLESLVVFKVSGESKKIGRMASEGGDELVRKEFDVWTLRIDVVPTGSYFKDPTGDGRYEIHEVERDWDYLWDNSEPGGMYDRKAVKQLEESFIKDKKKAGDPAEIERGGSEYRHGRGNRRRVVLREFWGDVLNGSGKVVGRNQLMTVANEKYLVRKMQDNPNWHQESPFVVAPLKRVPNSVWHAALYDDATQINFALNELFSLMFDGALASVWGVRQVREDWLEDPAEAFGGIAQGATLRVSSDAPDDAEVVKQVSGGQIPQDALQMFGILDKEFDSASRVSDINRGQLPGRKALATEIIEAQAGQGVMLDEIVGDVERAVVSKVLRKAWFVLLQGVEDLGSWDVMEVLGPRKTLRLSEMTAVERYSMFASCGFKVFGLSATLSKGRDFQKFMAALQAGAQVPILFQAMANRLSPDKVMDQMWRMLNMNPEEYEKTEDEKADPQGKVDLMTVTELLSGGKSQPGLASANTNREAAAVNQLGAPSEV